MPCPACGTALDQLRGKGKLEGESSQCWGTLASFAQVFSEMGPGATLENSCHRTGQGSA